jgi:hypothetical protein
MEKQEKTTRTSEEIDIGQFFKFIGKGTSSVGSGLLSAMAVLRNTFYERRVFFLIVISCGLILGVIYSSFLVKPYYKSSMVISCSFLNSQMVEDAIDNFNLMLQEPERTELSKAMNIDPSLGQSIHEFEFAAWTSEEDRIELELFREQLTNTVTERKDLIPKLIDKLKVESKSVFEITVYVYDPEIIRQLESSIVNYFKNNNFIKKRLEITNVNLNKRREKLIQESRKFSRIFSP